MLEFKSPDGYVFYLNHLISSLILISFLIWACWWLQQPKKDMGLHSGVCAFLTFVGISFINVIGFHALWWLGPVFAMLVGLGKEIADYLNPKKKKFDLMDIVADFIGTAAITITYVLSWLMHNPAN